jgi:WD40 repeat protein
MPRSNSSSDSAWRDLQALLTEELDRLPEKYRAPFLLCCLGGKSKTEAATELGWNEGTVSSRLARARERLRDRLSRRGVELSAVLGAVALTRHATAVVPLPLMNATIQAGLEYSAGKIAGSISAEVVVLAKGAIRTMVMSKVKTMTALLLVAGVAAGGVAALAQRETATQPTPQLQTESPKRKDRPGERPGAVAQNQTRLDRYGDPLPAGALARMGTVRLRHNHHSLLPTAFSSDGKLLASGGNEEIRIWDVATGKLLLEIRDGKRTLEYCALLFLPNGNRLIGAGRDSVCIWDSLTGKRLQEFPAASSNDGAVFVWELSTGKRTAELRQGHNDRVYSIAFTADGVGLVTMSQNNRVCHWDLAKASLRKAVDLPFPPNWCHALSPDGQTLVVTPRKGLASQGTTSLWDSTTCKERVKLQGELATDGYGLAFSPDGKNLIINAVGPSKVHEETTLGVWDVKTGELIRRLRLPTVHVNSLAFTPDGRTLLTTGYEPLVRLWDITTGKPVLQWAAHTHGAMSLAFTPDGRGLISGGLDGTVRLWEVSSGRQLRELVGHRWRCDVVAATGDGKAILSGGIDGCLRVQDRDGKQFHRILQDGPPEKLTNWIHTVLALGISSNSKTAVTWSRNLNGDPPVYHVWDLATGKALITRPDTSSGGSIPQISSDGKLVMEPVFEPAPDAAPAAAAGGGAGGAGYSGPSIGSVRLREVATGREVCTFRQPDGFAGLQEFAPDGRTVLTVTCRPEQVGDSWRYDETLHFWELAIRKERLTIPCPSSGYQIQRVAYAPNGRTVATARINGAIQLWDLSTGKELPQRLASNTEMNCLTFSPDSQLLASGHRDGTILIWDAAPSHSGVSGPHTPMWHSKSKPSQLDQWWDDLAGEDARRAFVAVSSLAAEPQSTVGLLRDRLRPATELQPEKLRGLIAELDSRQFSEREAAKKQLAAFGEQAGPVLRAALQNHLSAEQRRSIEQLLDTLYVVSSPKVARHVRAIEILERIGTPEAREVLEKLARGAADARPTQEAKASLERLAKRADAKP